MNHQVTSHGKEVKVNGQRWADATSEERARIINEALRNYFHKPTLLR